MRVIYMIGHSNHRIGDFLAMLERHKIQLLVDIRSAPTSRWRPWFNRTNLDQTLQSAGVGYCWLPALGGLTPAPRPTVVLTLTTLLSDQRTICLMCSEGDFQKCHRHYLLAPLIANLGCQVQQIAPTGALVSDCGPAQAHLK